MRGGEGREGACELLTEEVPVDAAGGVQRLELDGVEKLLLGVVEELREARCAARPAPTVQQNVSWLHAWGVGGGQGVREGDRVEAAEGVEVGAVCLDELPHDRHGRVLLHAGQRFPEGDGLLSSGGQVRGLTDTALTQWMAGPWKLIFLAGLACNEPIQLRWLLAPPYGCARTDSPATVR